MKPLWVVIGVCSCWLAFLVQPQQCTELSKETTEVAAGSVNNVPDNHHLTSLLSSVVSHVDGNSEPEVYITGFNGLCVTVLNGDYYNGNSIVLDECDILEQSQLWTLRSSDQTIRSEGMCMTASGNSPGDHMMIYNCWLADPNATKWQVRSDSRKIVNPISGLFLTAQRGSNGVYKLVVDHNHYVPRQAWVPTDYVPRPRVTKILGLHSLCLTLDGVQRVEMAECGQNVVKQRWAAYLDGTIRPELHQDCCLRFEHGQYVVSVGTCGGSSDEPWVFHDNNGTLLHLATGMVMDIKATPGRPTHFSPFLNCYDGSASQIWSVTAP